MAGLRNGVTRPGGGLRIALTVGAAGLLAVLAACGSSDGAGVDDTVVTEPTAPVDFADGAFERNVGGTSADGTAVVGTAPASDVATDTTPVADTTPASADDAGAGTSTTAQPTTTTAGSSGGAATTTIGAAPESGSGLVRIGAVTYPFDTETCDIDDAGFFIFGFGTSSAGDPVEVEITGETIDLDGDGTEDLNFDILVFPDLESGKSLNDLPEFYASKVTSADFNDGEEIEVSISATRIIGSGPIEDLNGIAVPGGQTLPMTFDVSCA